MPLWANSSEPSPANSVVYLEAPARTTEWDTLSPHRSVELYRAVSACLTSFQQKED